MKFNENLMRRAFSSNSYLFPEILIRDNPDEVTQILTGFEAVFIKNCFKAGKDLGHLMRLFASPYFRERSHSLLRNAEFFPFRLFYFQLFLGFH